MPGDGENLLHKGRCRKRSELHEAEQVRKGNPEEVLLLRGLRDVAPYVKTFRGKPQKEESFEEAVFTGVLNLRCCFQ